jgi:small-conductance mechanosensitive channel
VLATLIRAGVLALVVSLVANVLGYSALARLLGEAVLRSAFGALILYGALRVARAAFRVSLGSQRARSLLMVRGHSPLLLRSASRALSWFALFTWVVFTLEAFSLREVLADRARAALGASASFGTIEISLGGIFVGVLTFVVALLLSRLVRFVATEEVFPRLGVRVGAAHAASRAMHYGIVTLGILLALAAFGIDFNRFTLLAGALGVGVGFGLQNIVNNFLSGLILLFERPIQVGDSIEVGALLGDVKRIGIRSSTVRTWQGAEVIVPNANLISDQVVNWTLSDRQRRVDVPVGVAYGTDPERVLELLDRVAREQAGVLEHPAPRALFLGFGDSSLDFELRAWTPHFESYMATHSDLAVAIYRAFEEAGISIPFPQRDLHVKSLPESLSASLSGSKTRGEE